MRGKSQSLSRSHLFTSQKLSASGSFGHLRGMPKRAEKKFALCNEKNVIALRFHILLTFMLNIFERFLKTFVTSFRAKQLAASEYVPDLLAILIAVANDWKELKLGLPFVRALQFIFVCPLRYDR